MFGDDWPGVFIRGDEAHGYAMSLRQIIGDQVQLSWSQLDALHALSQLLLSADQRNPAPKTALKSYDECLPEKCPACKGTGASCEPPPEDWPFHLDPGAPPCAECQGRGTKT